MEQDKWELWEGLTLSNDFMFSKVMRDKEICRETLEILLDKKIGEITYIDNQKTIDINYDAKSVRLDVYVEDENRIYNIEMQVVNKKDLAKRSRYYQGMIDLNAIEKGEIYRDLKESIVIFICKFDPFGEGLSKYTFENICNENKELYLKDGTSKVFFNTKDYYKERSEDAKSFLEYIEKETTSENNFVKKLEQKIKNIKENKVWRAEFMTLLMREQEIARDNFEKGMAEGVIKGREEGIAEGVIRGREEGIAEGVIKGRKEGIAEGVIKGRQEATAKGIEKIIEIYREELNFEDEIIIQKLVKKYNLTKEEAEKYLNFKN